MLNDKLDLNILIGTLKSYKVWSVELKYVDQLLPFCIDTGADGIVLKE